LSALVLTKPKDEYTIVEGKCRLSFWVDLLRCQTGIEVCGEQGTYIRRSCSQGVRPVLENAAAFPANRLQPLMGIPKRLVHIKTFQRIHLMPERIRHFRPDMQGLATTNTDSLLSSIVTYVEREDGRNGLGWTSERTIKAVRTRTQVGQLIGDSHVRAEMPPEEAILERTLSIDPPNDVHDLSRRIM